MTGWSALVECGRRLGLVMKIRPTLALALVVTFAVALPLGAQRLDQRTARSRRDLPPQGGRAAALEGDGGRELSHRRLRTAAHRLAEHQGSGRLGREDDAGLGAGERAPRNVSVRPRLAEPAVRRARPLAASLPADRVSEGVDARHERPGHRRGRHGGHPERSGFRQVPRQAARQVRPRPAAGRVRFRPASTRQGRRFTDSELSRPLDAAAGAAAAETAPRTATPPTRRRSIGGRRSSGSTRAWPPSSTRAPWRRRHRVRPSGRIAGRERAGRRRRR